MGEGELREEMEKALKEQERRCTYIVAGEFLAKYDFKVCHLRDTVLYVWTEEFGWHLDEPETIPLCDEPVHEILMWKLCPGDEALLVRLRRNMCEEPFEVEIMRFWFGVDGTMRSKVIDTLVLDADKAWDLLYKLTENKERDVHKLLNELKVAIGLQPSG